MKIFVTYLFAQCNDYLQLFPYCVMAQHLITVENSTEIHTFSHSAETSSRS